MTGNNIHETANLDKLKTALVAPKPRRKIITKNRVFLSFKFIIPSFFLVIFLGPFLLVLTNSFKSIAGYIASPLALPQSWDFSNYLNAFQRMDFMVSFWNSLVVTVCSVGMIVLISSMAGYIFVRKNWNFVFYLMVASMFIPFQAIMIPLVGIYGGFLHILNNKWALIYMNLGFGTCLPVVIYHGFVKGVPMELEEAAMIDGCSKHKTFFKIVFPLLKPATTTIIILQMLWIWNDYLLPVLVLQASDCKTLPMKVFEFFGSYNVEYTLVLAGLMMSMIPSVVVYLLLQKYIIKGIMQGAIK